LQALPFGIGLGRRLRGEQRAFGVLFHGPQRRGHGVTLGPGLFHPGARLAHPGFRSQHCGLAFGDCRADLFLDEVEPPERLAFVADLLRPHPGEGAHAVRLGLARIVEARRQCLGLILGNKRVAFGALEPLVHPVEKLHAAQHCLTTSGSRRRKPAR